jgi:predicted SAM-dependent methyltransferase
MIKVNLGAGKDLKKDFINVYVVEDAEVKHDLDVYPYPFKSNSVDYINCSNVLEHLKEPMDFFKEVYRILKKGGRARIQVPHHIASGAAYGSLEHRNFFHEDAIDSVTGVQLTEFKNHPFKLIQKKVVYGRFLFWQKREIIWVIEK